MQTEAYAVKMQTMRESWTDERLDDLNGRVSDGFRHVDERFRQVNGRFERIDARLDSIRRMIAFGAIILSGSFIAGFAVLAARI